MAKKKTKPSEPKVVEKTLGEMTDSEYLKNVEPMGEPFYFDYLGAPQGRNTSVNGYVSETRIGMLAYNAKHPIKETPKKTYVPQNTVKTKNYVRKRTFLLVLIALLSLGMIAVIALGAAGLSFSRFFNLFDREKGDVEIVDAAAAVIEHHTGAELRSDFAGYFADLDSPQAYVAPYAVSVATILFAICILVVFIKAMVALFEKRSTLGYFKKRKFGFLAIVAFLCALIAFVGGMYAEGMSIADVVKFADPSNNAFGAGFGLYAMLAVPVLILVFSSFAYGKKMKR